MAYRIYTESNMADTWRDPNEILTGELGYKHSLEDAKSLAMDYIKDNVTVTVPVTASVLVTLTYTSVVGTVSSLNPIILGDIKTGLVPSVIASAITPDPGNGSSVISLEVSANLAACDVYTRTHAALFVNIFAAISSGLISFNKPFEVLESNNGRLLFLE